MLKPIAKSLLFLLPLLMPGLAPAAALNLSPSGEDLIARVDSLWHSRRQGAADSLLRVSLPAARAEADSALLLGLRLRQGHMHAALGRGYDAESPLREARSLAMALGDSLRCAAALRWLGVALINQGRVEDSQQFFAEQFGLSRAIGNIQHEAWALTGLAHVDMGRGEVDSARARYEEAARLFQGAGLAQGELFALNGLGIALSGLADFEASRRCYARTASVARERGFLHMEALAENNLGTLEYTLGDPGRALKHFQRAYDLHSQDGNLREGVIPATNLSLCQSALGRHGAARENFAELLRTCLDQGFADLERDVRIELGNSLLKQERPRFAATLFRGLLAEEGELNRIQIVEATIGLIGALADVDSIANALALIEEREDQVRGLGEPLLELQFEILKGRQLRRLDRPGRALEILLAVDDQASSLGLKGYRLEALPEAALAAQALGMPDSAMVLWRRAAGVWEDERGLPLDPEWREIRGAAGAEIFSRLALLTLEHPPDVAASLRLQRAYDLLQTYKARTLLERTLGPAGAIEAPALSLQELQGRVLRRGELVLDYYLGSAGSLLFTVTRDEVRVHRLPAEQELVGAVDLFRALLAQAPREKGPIDPETRRRALGDGAATLAGILLQGASDPIRTCDRLLFAPDGVLNGLPIAALLDLAAPLKELVPAALPVQRVPSTGYLATLRRAERSEPTSPLRALALSTNAGRRAEDDSLPGTRREVTLLTSRYRGVERRVVGDASALVDSLAEFDLLHFAAHSTANDEFPWQSSIYLGVTPEGGALRLSAAAIAALNLKARLAVLASCESARGRVLSGEGVQGLSSAFLSAGVPAVVASLWPVDDEATARLMEHFYASLARDVDAATALRRAQAELRLEARWRAPFFWSAFVLVGDGSVHAPLQTRQNPLLLSILFGLSLVCVFLWFGLSLFRRHKSRFL